ncbi:DUF1849 family protein [Jiella sp. M17.18]|uniref:EipB family protein n=1 Tax=Jiella sp. M17.18 TaxID=3234247 RepID=UPI0034DFE7F5
MQATSVVLFAVALLLPAGAALAVPLAPHRASYDLKLLGDADSLINADGRIGIELRQDKCAAYDLDYRFVARFQQEQELVVTDQQTHTRESLDGRNFSFQTKTFVDSSPDGTVKGTARTTDSGTTVSFSQPSAHTVDLPTSLFPMGHTSAIIERAKAGERIVEYPVFDGDADAEKHLTSTSVIAPVTPGDRAGEPAPADGAPPPQEGSASPGGSTAKKAASPADQLKGLKSWRISESYYNSDSDADGLPIFQTSYTLYENGVSDDLVLTFNGYTLAGGLKSLDLFAQPDCPPSGR